MRRGEQTLEALYERFPGKLRVDRYEVRGRHVPASEHGPLLELELISESGEIDFRNFLREVMLRLIITESLDALSDDERESWDRFKEARGCSPSSIEEFLYSREDRPN